MIRRITSKFELFDPEIERIFCNLVKSKLSPKKEGKEIMAIQEGAKANRSLMDNVLPSFIRTIPNIRRSTV